jgi:hypothetical protein
MSPAIRNALSYVIVFLLPPVADGVFQYLRAHPGEPIDWQQLGYVATMSAVAAYVASTRPKAGHEELSAQADAQVGKVDESGHVVRHRDLTVVTKDEAIQAITDAPATTIGRTDA